MSNKKRAIDSSIRKSQTFARLTFQQRDLWHGLIAVADDQGRLPGLPAYVRSQVWPYQDIELQVVASDLATLESIGNIMIYQASGQTFVQIVNWWKYQAMQWAGPSDYPAPEGWIDRMRFHTADNKVKAVNWNTPGGFLISVSTPVPTGVPTHVPTELGSRDGDVNGEDKGNGEGEGEVEDDALPANPLLAAFVKYAQVPDFGTGRAAEALQEMIAAGVIPEDIQAAVAWMDQMGYSIRSLASIVKPAITEAGKRKRGGNEQPKPLSKSNNQRVLERYQEKHGHK